MSERFGTESEVLGRWPEPAAPSLRLLLRQWALWRDAEGRPPARSRIDPGLLKPCLPDMWLFRLMEGGKDLVCTLAGENIREAWGFSIIGKRPEELWGETAGRVARSRMARAAKRPALIHGLTGILPDGTEGKAAERLILPLVDDAAAPWGALGITCFRFNPIQDRGRIVGPVMHSTLYPCADLPKEPPPESAI